MTVVSTGAATHGSALLNAAQWIETTIQGPIATGIAVLAIAAVGLMMLTGRLALRKGLFVTLGCFLMFGAPAIARGLFVSATSLAGNDSPPAPLVPIGASPPPAAVQSNPQISDPYAGAALVR